jgi:mxaD protein
MKKALLAFLAVALTLPITVLAGNAKTLKVVKTIGINAPAKVVWAKVYEFDDLGSWHPAVKKTELVEGKNNVKGAVRVLTLQDGGTIKEKLRSYNAKGMTFEYEILEGALPVSSYVSSVTVKSGKRGVTTVVWKGRFKRKDTSAKPAAGQDDESAVKTIATVYQAGLDNLKKISEQATSIKCPQGAAAPCTTK